MEVHGRERRRRRETTASRKKVRSESRPVSAAIFAAPPSSRFTKQENRRTLAPQTRRPLRRPFAAIGHPVKLTAGRPNDPGHKGHAHRMRHVDRCDDCGYVYEEQRAPDVPQAVVALGSEYARRLGGAGSWLKKRPASGVWSALEYACHVRDVFIVQRERLFLALMVDTPSFTPMYRDQRVDLAGYSNQDPVAVAEQLKMAASLFADAFGRVDEAGLTRSCIYNYPTPERRSLAWLGVHTLHEGKHHLQDIDRVLASLQ